ncbi:uncharacterized protein LOC122514309 [Polistes fuscatus]|uniref:uncharacterized protein LOC122514309 n=1 Tax=Polistes fuscatus TaxID=30207 RepID=UPI001CA895DE|nr:uncharacterized protein LOC122514309 [Polistes fuscatus]
MCIIEKGLMFLSIISDTICNFYKIAINETDEDTEKSAIFKEQNGKPIKPPRRSQKYSKLNENNEFFSSQPSRERCNTKDSTISNDQTKRLVRVQLENIPNKTTSNSEERLNSSKSLMSKNDVNFVSNDNELKHSSIILLENINDYAEKSVTRKTLNVRNEEIQNENDTIYFSLPENLGFLKNPILTSTKTNISDESKIIKKYIYLINEDNLNNDVPQIVTIEIKKSTNPNRYGNHNTASSSNSYHRKNENLETSSIKRKKRRSKLLLCYSK